MTVEDALADHLLRDALAEQYRSSIAAAERGFPQHAADEDSVTGGLGQAMQASGYTSLSDGSWVSWRTTYIKLRGRGARAPEKRLGADGMFEVEVEDGTGAWSRKSLAFQAKKNGTLRIDDRLRKQADQISQLPGGGLVVVFSSDGYFAADAAAFAAAGAPSHSQSLADALASDFLGCRLGSSGYYYDAVREVMVVSTPAGLLDIRKIPVRSRIRTSVRLRK